MVLKALEARTFLGRDESGRASFQEKEHWLDKQGISDPLERKTYHELLRADETAMRRIIDKRLEAKRAQQSR